MCFVTAAVCEWRLCQAMMSQTPEYNAAVVRVTGSSSNVCLFKARHGMIPNRIKNGQNRIWATRVAQYVPGSAEMHQEY